MTRVEAKLRKAGLGDEIDCGNIRINSPREVAVYVPDCNAAKTRILADLVMELTGWDGTGNGTSWHIRKPSYQRRHNHFVVMLDQLGLGAYEK